MQGELICPFCKRSSIGGMTHPICKRKYGLDGLWSLGVYRGVLKQAIQKMKYRAVTSLVEELVDITINYWAIYDPLILDKIKQDGKGKWVVAPVPLHKFRQNWRGFNQSALLAQNFARKLGLKYENHLKRIKNTKPQFSLSAHERNKNVKNAFSLNTKYKIPNTNILLIDDVWTTGSTMAECCRVLKRNGAKTVWALTLSR